MGAIRVGQEDHICETAGGGGHGGPPRSCESALSQRRVRGGRLGRRGCRRRRGSGGEGAVRVEQDDHVCETAGGGYGGTAAVGGHRVQG